MCACSGQLCISFASEIARAIQCCIFMLVACWFCIVDRTSVNVTCVNVHVGYTLRKASRCPPPDAKREVTLFSVTLGPMQIFYLRLMMPPTV